MVSPDMVRRFAALAGIILILAVVTALVWTVHQHKTKTALPADAVDVIQRMCRRDPARRYGSLDEVLEDMAILA